MAETPSAPVMDPNAWKAPDFRQKIVTKLDEVMRNTGPYMGKTGADWENHLFPKAKSKEEYLSLIAKLIQHLQSFAGVQPGMGGPGPGPMGVGPGGPMTGARVPFNQSGFAGHGMQPGRMPQGVPRNDMFLVQQPPMGGMVRPGGPGAQPSYVMMQNQLRMIYQQQQMMGTGNMVYQNTLDMPHMGSAVASPMMPGSGPGSVGLVSPGGIMIHSPGGPGGILPSPANAASPGNINTPGNPGSVNAHNEEQAYMEKWNQLQKYVEPLKRMINKIDKDEDRQRDLNKMKNLLDILSDSSKRLPYATLLKCETVLEKLEFSGKTSQSAVVPPLTGPSEHMCQQLLDAVANHLKSPTLNHTLQRTFGPAVRALHGPPLRSDSPPAKRPCIEEVEEISTPDDDIPELVQCEIARLHRRFVISLDPSHHPGSRVVHLLCRLEDKKLPSVPPIMVTLPENYPDSSPTCKTLPAHYDSTPFLRKVNEILTTEIKYMSGRYSLTALLNFWDVCVRKACSPTAVIA